MPEQLRPCIVDGRRAMFLRFSDTTLCIKHSHDWKFELEHRKVITGNSTEEKDTEYFPCTMAIVEYEDGQVGEVYPSEIRFIDGGGFDAVEWPEDEGSKQ